MRHALLFVLVLLAACPSAPPPETVDFDGDGTPDQDDCAPADPAVHPGATEVVGDGTDQDCDGLDDVDVDGDGSPSLLDCDDANDLLDALDRDADGFSLCDGDCDDADADVQPDAVEIPGDGTDQDCDGNDDIDADGDGTFSLLDCDDEDPALNRDDLDGDGASNCEGDCDETDPALNPNDADTDGQTSCDGDCDDDDAARTSLDADGDGASTCDVEPDCDDGSAQLNLHDVDGDTYSTCDGDCADTDSLRRPGAPERCNALDDNCDTVLPVNELDGDGDGDIACLDCDDGDPGVTGLDTDADGFSPCTGDCNEGVGTIYPGAPDSAGDTLDQNCDGTDGVDADGDGWAVNAASSPDCDDGDATTYPGATEVCDGIDSDCVLDPAELDDDGDGASPCAGDCDDGSATLNISDADGDGLDSCAGDCNDADPTVNLSDADGDGLSGCAGDCDDTDPAINPSAAEVCDGADNDCDGVTGSPDTFTQQPGPNLQAAQDVLNCGVFEIAAGAWLTSFDLRIQPSGSSTVTFALFEGPSPTGPWTRQWASAPAGVTTTSMQWILSGPVNRTLTAGTFTALCMNVTEDISRPGSWTVTGLPAATSFGTYVNAIDEIEVSAMPLAMAETGWPTWMPIRVHTVTSEADADGDGESACTDCADGDAAVSNNDGDGDGLSGCAGDCDDGDAGVPATGWEAPWDGVDSDCDGTDATGLDLAGVNVLGSGQGRFGGRVVVAGDVNGDGVDDLFVSAPDIDGAYPDTGRVVLLSGAALLAGTANPASPLASIVGVEEDDAVGEDMVALPDLDGDGFPELAVWSPEVPYPQYRPGEILIFASQNGTWGGLNVTPSAAALHITPQVASESFSPGLRADGDLDGDGLNDLVIPNPNWSPGYEGDEGAALVFSAAQLAAALGGGPLVADDAWLILAGEFVNSLAGSWVEFVPDLDADGRAELLVGSSRGPRTWTGTEWYFPSSGQVHLVLSTDMAAGGICALSLTGCSTTVIAGDAPGDRWYRALAVGDLDGDSLSDIAIGSGYVSGSGYVRGWLGVYTASSLLLGGTLLRTDADGWLEGGADLDLFAALHVSLGDLDGDGLVEVLSSLTDLADSGFMRPGALIITGAALAATLTGAPGDATAATEAFAALDSDAGVSTGGGLGDLDGDGAQDLWLGAPYRDLTGTSDGVLHLLELP